MAGEFTGYAEQVIVGVFAYPETWGRVRACVGELPYGPVDLWVATAWRGLDRLHEANASLSPSNLFEQMEAISKSTRPGDGFLSEFSGTEIKRLSSLSGRCVMVRHSSEALATAERLMTARSNAKLANMLNGMARAVAGDVYADPLTHLDDVKVEIQKTHRRVSRVELGNAAERARIALESTRPAAIPTGFAALDKVACGVDIGELTLIGARTGGGKSTFLAGLARNQIFPRSGCSQVDMFERAKVAETGPHVLVVSCENSADMFFQRLACDMLDISAHAMRDAKVKAIAESDLEPSTISKKELLAALQAYPRLTVIDESDTRDVSSSTICAAIEAWADDAEADDPDASKLVLIDYFQRVDPSETIAKEQRYRQVELVAKAFKGVARTRELAVVLAVQLNDTPNNAEPRRDSTRDSRGGNSEAANVWLLHSWTGEQRARLADKSRPVEVLNSMSLFSDKGRSTGEGWRVMLTFEGERYRITDAPDDTNPLLDPETLKIATPKPRPKPRS